MTKSEGRIWEERVLFLIMSLVSEMTQITSQITASMSTKLKMISFLDYTRRVTGVEKTGVEKIRLTNCVLHTAKDLVKKIYL